LTPDAVRVICPGNFATGGAGFEVVDFDEPNLTRDRYHLAANKRQLSNGKSRPYSVAFKLKKK
jgi:hypothetical protein